MKKIADGIFTGERAGYFSENTDFTDCVFKEGESQLKHGKNISAENCGFEYKYPLWNCENVKVKGGVIKEMGRAGIWYTDNLSMENVQIDAPKEFRRCRNVKLTDVAFSNAAETLWACRNVEMKNVSAKGDYFAMNTSGITAENLTLDGNYPFDGGKDITIRSSRLISKDAFWNCENVTVYDSYIEGEYLGWNSRNLRFVNCVISSEQGLCYIKDLKMENCSLKDSNLVFEYVENLDAEVKDTILSVKNPVSGKLKAAGIKELILNPERVDVSKTEIDCPNIEKTYSQDPNPNER